MKELALKQDSVQNDSEYYSSSAIYVPSYNSKVSSALTGTLVPVLEHKEDIEQDKDTEQESKDAEQGNRVADQEKEEAEDKVKEADEETDYLDNINETVETLRMT